MASRMAFGVLCALGMCICLRDGVAGTIPAVRRVTPSSDTTAVSRAPQKIPERFSALSLPSFHPGRYGRTPVVPPDPRFDYKILVIRPNPCVDYKMSVGPRLRVPEGSLPPDSTGP